uniref:Ferritin n=1 Tax=Cacopsylla melanoneura TaxID=428564 RepID=A0A8D8WK93_9HEMI
MELYASYVYLSMSAHFDRDVVALHGISKYFKYASEEESEFATVSIKLRSTSKDHKSIGTTNIMPFFFGQISLFVINQKQRTFDQLILRKKNYNDLFTIRRHSHKEYNM